MKSIRVFLIAVLVLVTGGFASAQTVVFGRSGGGTVTFGNSGTDYGSGAVRTAQNVHVGVVLDVLASRVTEEASTSARVIGATAGAAVCAPMASRWHSWTAQAAAMTLCGAVGERIGNNVGTTRASVQTIVVQLQDGRTVAVVQDDPSIQRGDRVYVMSGNGTRVVKAGAAL